MVPIAVLVTALWLAAPAQDPPVAQLDVPDVVRHLLGREPQDREADEARSRSLLPTIGSRPEAGVAFGALLSLQGRAAPEAPLSLFTASASYSTSHRTQANARLDQPLGEGWRLIGEWRFYNLTERTYGLGSDTSDDRFISVPLTGGRAYATVYRSLVGPLAVGAGYQFDTRSAHGTATVPAVLPEASDSHRTTTASGASLNALFDSRDNSINATRGALGRASMSWFPTAFGSSRSWQSLQLEGRTYWRVPSSRRQVVAMWSFAWIALGREPTYFDLPAIGWDASARASRGYAQGRFRGRGWIGAEAEYRVDVLRNGLVGATAFANTSTFSDNDGRYGRWLPAAGIGLRVKLDKRHGSNLCVDYAWGADGSRGLFLALNEAF